MKFIPTPLKDAFVIEPTLLEDHRGFFTRAFCNDTFSKKNLESNFIQANNSLSYKKGTLRGMHFQLPPKQEVKLIRCIQGELYDVIIDLRKESPTYKQWFGEKLTAKNRKMMYAPKGFAHGFITLTDNAEAFYLNSTPYCKELERGVRWDDPAFNIQWPIKPTEISEKDQNHKFYEDTIHRS